MDSNSSRDPNDLDAMDTVNEDDGVFAHFENTANEPLYAGEGDKATPIGAIVSGTYSSYYREAEAKVTKSVIALVRRGVQPDMAAGERNQLSLEVACIRSWTLVRSGKPLPITVENWRSVIAKQPQWQTKVRATMNAHELFSKAS